MPLFIYGTPLSPFARKVYLAAHMKGLSFQSIDINPHTSPDQVAALNPLKQIPIIDHDGYVLTDSSAICGYLDAAFPETAKLLPVDAKAKGRALWIEEYADTALSEVIMAGVFRPLFVRLLLGQTPDLATVEDTIENRLPEPLSYLNAQIEASTWFSGDDLSIADLAVYAQLVTLEHAGRFPQKGTYPNLVDHYMKIQKLPAMSMLMRSERNYLDQAIVPREK